MALPSRLSDFDARYLCRLLSAVSSFASAVSPSAVHPPGVSPPAASPPPFSLDTDSLTPASLTTASFATAPTLSFSGSPLPPRVGRSWIITEKLSERAIHLIQEDLDIGSGSPMTVGRFLCHLEEDPAQIAFMRIYYQIPITGTEDADLATLTQQIQPHEAVALLHVSLVTARKRKGTMISSLVAVKYLVWEKVPGEPLTEEFFWSLDLLVREDIRAKFQAAFEELLRCGVKPLQSRLSKIIYDQSIHWQCSHFGTPKGMANP
ncbi:hypothetical protein PENCOP_c006G06294 [Penicillium coprophilum]|uniref:Uncharacterized protein n=1 Tax=Penicillium coprophilum TaxID=36646 RepID=A0A1V6UNQ1_9EURO|nr:hypothetical protein PENCOP_c006G06294 [Penicillium coprophilum]